MPSGTVKKQGAIATLQGGTRTLPVGLLQRLWQTSPVYDPKNCPFCTKEQQVVARHEAGEWLELENLFTPYPFHRLYIPTQCWTMDRLYNLGGKESIKTVLRLAQKAAEESKGTFPLLWLGTHVGYLAGLNVATHHVHHHLLSPVEAEDGTAKPCVTRPEIPWTETDSALTQFKEGGFTVTLGGIRTGQCLIFPTQEMPAEDASAALARALNRVIECGASKFRSMQWLPPDYMIVLMYFEGRVIFGSYIPVLNNWGFTELATLTLLFLSEKNRGIGAITLPCPEAVVAELIRNT